MHMSQHATIRSQQRAISQMQVDLLMQFGTSERRSWRFEGLL